MSDSLIGAAVDQCASLRVFQHQQSLLDLALHGDARLPRHFTAEIIPLSGFARFFRSAALACPRSYLERGVTLWRRRRGRGAAAVALELLIELRCSLGQRRPSMRFVFAAWLRRVTVELSELARCVGRGLWAARQRCSGRSAACGILGADGQAARDASDARAKHSRTPRWRAT